MKYLITILLFAICHIGQAQQTVLTNDSTIAIPKVNFDEKGELKIAASTTSSPNDFDFLVGKWKIPQQTTGIGVHIGGVAEDFRDSG